MDGGLNKGASGKLFGFARINRKKQTAAEQLLWQELRNRKLSGFKFRRQHPISSFIADFYCHEAQLVVELDGGYHSQEEQLDYDRGRDFALNLFSLKVLRFRNEEVLEDIDLVLKKIREHLNPNSSAKS